MDFEQRIEILEDAHRAMAAQHLALMQICKLMLPLMTADRALVRAALLTVYDQSNKDMDNLGYDTAFQADVRETINELSSVILGEADKS